MVEAADSALDMRGATASLGTGRRLWYIFGGSIGNLIEWYDFYIYNFFALYFAKSFFPGANPTAQLLNAYGIYAFGFVIRPVGSWVLGIYADRHGRRAGLTLSVLLMCLGTVIIAACPTFAAIGLWAPAVLLLARLFQGFSLGGEYGSSATYLAEIAPERRRGLFTSFHQMSLIGGQLLGSLTLLLLQSLLSGAQMGDWGWRAAFGLSALLALYGFYLRLNLMETDQFRRLTPAQRASTGLGVMMRYPREVALVFGLSVGGVVAGGAFSTYMVTFLVNSVHLSPAQSAQISASTLFVYFCLQPLFGHLADRIGRWPILLWFGVLGTIFTVPIFYGMLHTHSYATAWLLLMAALVITTGYTSVNALVKAEMFPTEVRALGVGFPYAVATAAFAGTSPTIGLYFKQIGHEPWYFYYIAGLIAVALVAILFIGESRESPLIGE